MTQSPDNEARRLSRLWRVPPALLRNPSSPETLEGESILAETPGASGLMLWRCYRDALLWACTPSDVRSNLFRRASGKASVKANETLLDSGLDVETLRALRRLRIGVRRLNNDDGSMATAAMVVASAAERGGVGATAVAYAQLAAAIDPSSASAALSVGRMALRLGHFPVAETWLRRAIALARRSSDWKVYAAALAALGEFRERTNRLSEARVEYLKSLRMARRSRGRSKTVEEAMSGLLRIALRQDDQVAAHRYAEWVLRSRRRDLPRPVSVLLDVAEVEVRNGEHNRAVVLLRKALPRVTDENEEVRALILLVRALGAVGDWLGVEEAWHHALDVIDGVSSGGSPEAARLLLVLARAGAEVRQELHADRAARRALARARQSGDEELISDCETFLARRFPRAA